MPAARAVDAVCSGDAPVGPRSVRLRYAAELLRRSTDQDLYHNRGRRRGAGARRVRRRQGPDGQRTSGNRTGRHAGARGASAGERSSYADVYADELDAIAAELDTGIDDRPGTPLRFPTADAARFEAYDEALEALNRRYLKGNDACVDPDVPLSCFEDNHAEYDEDLDWLIQRAGADWYPSTTY
jgi:hypothetical protein